LRKKVIGVALSALLLTVSFPAAAQQPKKIPRIALIAFGGSRPARNFMTGLHERGYVEGQSIIIKYHSAEGRPERLSEIAAESVRLKPDVIVADGNDATDAAKEATATIPIVFMHGDPVWDGTVKSLAQSGNNLTGLSVISFDLARKRLELLRDAFPKISRVAVLMDADAAVHRRQFDDMQNAGKGLGVQLQALKLRFSSPDFDAVFQTAISQRANALLTLPNPVFDSHRKRVLEFAAKNQLPAMYPFRAYTVTGGLMSYGVNSAELWRRAAYFVDRILKGAKPGDLPIEQPTKFELVINLKTARELNPKISPEVLMWADRVIK
jgi:putative ABC transport system substrate-binding protein